MFAALRLENVVAELFIWGTETLRTLKLCMIQFFIKETEENIEGICPNNFFFFLLCGLSQLLLENSVSVIQELLQK